jgi:hypothetical protein
MAFANAAFRGLLLAVGCCFVMSLFFSSTRISEHNLIEQCSPDKAFCASVYLSSSSTALDSDVYYVRVRSVQGLWHWSHWANSGRGERVLTTVEVKPTRLVWASDNLLNVYCDGCQIHGGDVDRQKSSSGPVQIRFVGFGG